VKWLSGRSTKKKSEGAHPIDSSFRNLCLKYFARSRDAQGRHLLTKIEAMPDSKEPVFERNVCGTRLDGFKLPLLGGFPFATFFVLCDFSAISATRRSCFLPLHRISVCDENSAFFEAPIGLSDDLHGNRFGDLPRRVFAQSPCLSETRGASNALPRWAI